jgi:GDP-L-fucose synthase
VSGGEPSRSFWAGRDVRVTGGTGFLGSHVCARLDALGADVEALGGGDADLRDAGAAREVLAGADVVFHLAARVGGIGFNRRNHATLAHDNLLMGANVFEAARLGDVGKLVCACSVCAYPAETRVPFREDDVWSGYPEESNAPYGLAKRMLLVLSASYRAQHGLDSCAPIITNLYGPGDNYDLEDSHVVAAMIRKFTEAAERNEEEVVLWGTGSPTRELLHADDAARGLILAAERLDDSTPINLGTGTATSIRDLAEEVRAATGYGGALRWDASRPDGQAERRLDVSRARELIGFEAQVSLEEGLAGTVAAFRGGQGTGAAAAN